MQIFYVKTVTSQYFDFQVINSEYVSLGARKNAPGKLSPGNKPPRKIAPGKLPPSVPLKKYFVKLLHVMKYLSVENFVNFNFRQS